MSSIIIRTCITAEGCMGSIYAHVLQLRGGCMDLLVTCLSWSMGG